MKKHISLLVVLCLFLNTIPIMTTATSFSDFDKTHWAYSNVMDMVTRGIINGYPDGTFQPDKAVTRAEFCVLLSRIKNLNPEASNTTSKHWAKPYIDEIQKITWCYNELFLNGNLSPDDSVCRGEVAIAISEIYLQAPISPASEQEAISSHLAQTYVDAHNFGIYSNYIYSVSTNNLMQGYSDGCFHPEKLITRSELCTLLSRAFPQSNSSNTNNIPTYDSFPMVPDCGAILCDKLVYTDSKEGITIYMYQITSASKPFSEYHQALQTVGYIPVASSEENNLVSVVWSHPNPSFPSVMLSVSTVNSTYILSIGSSNTTNDSASVKSYPQTMVPDYSAVTGAKLKTTLTNGDGLIYCYNFNHTESTAYIQYLNSHNWGQGSSEQTDTYTILFFAKNNTLITFTIFKDIKEVWVYYSSISEENTTATNGANAQKVRELERLIADIDSDIESMQAYIKELKSVIKEINQEIKTLKTELNNVSKNATTRVMVGGSWRMVADPSLTEPIEEMINDLEYEKEEYEELLEEAQDTLKELKDCKSEYQKELKALN